MTDLLTRDELAAIRQRSANDGYFDLDYEYISADAPIDVAALLAHIDALEAALKATYDTTLGGWFDSDGNYSICFYCGAKHWWRDNTLTHKPDCQGEALKAALGLGKDGER